jgi:hypothetical protein
MKMTGLKSVIVGVILVIVGFAIIIPLIKFVAAGVGTIIILILGGWFIVKGLRTIKK